MTKKLIITSGLVLLSCSHVQTSQDVSRTLATQTKTSEDFWKAFPMNPPFELAESDIPRYKSLWKRALCLHSSRSQLTGKDLKRTFHHKIHGCLNGKLELDPHRPKETRVGVFKKNAPLSVMLRYSNINSIPDNRVDLRGLGIKVRIPKSEVTNKLFYQDFLVNDTRRHFASTPEDILEFNEYTARGMKGIEEYALNDLPDLVKVFGDPRKGLQLLQTNPIEYLKAIQAHPELPFKYTRRAIDIQIDQGDRPLSLLTKEFHSRAPFMLGKEIIKYGVIPCDMNGVHPMMLTENHLGEDLAFNAKNANICLDFIVQFYKDEAMTPLKDYTKIWKSPRIVIGRFNLDQEEIHSADKDARCESMVLDPWHSLPEHRPTGPINYGRWYIYHASRIQSNPSTRLDVDCDQR